MNVTKERGKKQLKLTLGGKTHPLAHQGVEIPAFDGSGKQLMDRGDVERDGNEGDRLIATTVLVQQGTCLARYLRLDLHRTVINASSWNTFQRDLVNAVLGSTQGGGLSQNWGPGQRHRLARVSGPMPRSSTQADSSGVKTNGPDTQGRMDSQIVETTTGQT